LIADTTRLDAPSSIAVVGFALSAYPVGVERGWMARDDAVTRVLAALRFFQRQRSVRQPAIDRASWLYYHFLDMRSGTRTWRCEVSLIDSAFLMAGMLTAAAYFDTDSADESELRHLAVELYRRSTGAGRSATEARSRMVEARVRLPELWLGGLQRGDPALRARPRLADASADRRELSRLDGHLSMGEPVRS
jgi:hypothetical protein